MRVSGRISGATPPWAWPVATVLIVWGLWAAFEGRTMPPAPRAGTALSDLHLFTAVTERVRAGEDYYRSMAEELPARHYATKSVFNWRLPTLFYFASTLPPIVVRGILVTLCFSVVAAWLAITRRDAPSIAIPAMPVLFISVPAAVHPMGPMMHELWAGLLIAGALAVRSFGWIVAALLLGATAVAIRELSAPFIGVMAALAWWDSRRLEAVAWASVGAAFLVFMAWHSSQVAAVMPPVGNSRDWLVLGGWPFVLVTARANPLLGLAPAWVAALVLPVALVGLWRWSGDLGRRLACTVSVYFVLFMVAGRPDNWYWGFVVAPLVPLGLYGLDLPAALRRLSEPAPTGTQR